MLPILPRVGSVLLGGLGLACLAGLALAVPAPEAPPVTVVKDRSAFIPRGKHLPLGGKAVGVLIPNVQAFMGHEGRSGPPDAMGFSAAGASYRWVYVPVADAPLIQNLRVPTGSGVKLYPSLSMANPYTVKRWGLPAEASLVEAEVNDGLGSPAQESFVGTKLRRLDGTADYPLVVSRVLADLRGRYQASLKHRGKALDAALDEAGKRVLKGRTVTGPRETAELLDLTWLPESERLAVHFRTRVSDGAYTFVNVPGANPFGRPPPALPALPPGGAVMKPAPAEGTVRVGVTFGVEFGNGYEVDRKGRVARVLELPVESFSSEFSPRQLP